jgi:hypothetical protein
MLLKGFSKLILFLLFVFTLGLLFVPVQADIGCKGLKESACRVNPSCIWVSGYTTKKGRSVSAYCRGRGGKPETGHNFKGEKGTQFGANDRAAGGARKIARKLEEHKSG